MARFKRCSCSHGVFECLLWESKTCIPWDSIDKISTRRPSLPVGQEEGSRRRGTYLQRHQYSQIKVLDSRAVDVVKAYPALSDARLFGLWSPPLVCARLFASPFLPHLPYGSTQWFYPFYSCLYTHLAFNTSIIKTGMLRARHFLRSFDGAKCYRVHACTFTVMTARYSSPKGTLSSGILSNARFLTNKTAGNPLNKDQVGETAHADVENQENTSAEMERRMQALKRFGLPKSLDKEAISAPQGKPISERKRSGDAEEEKEQDWNAIYSDYIWYRENQTTKGWKS